jgi:hypothetical protein
MAMKFKLEFDDDGVMYDVMDTIFVALLKRAIKDANSDTLWTHPDDKKAQKQLADACQVLIEYYGEPND